ncbi:sperm flagellar protein 1 isoform X1 [Astyanax mexicanus]|uniref:Sperm flagellar protein 1 isoform X1 n=2 Tax=Astyanax mexicanus TaxID=7994 RepID=A0A8B9RG05_ASTMX|nr:sperm flagellar protein 1 isoform X1 [Astyanax mexicanus]KAG9275446.1 sperm flagellar protein 1 isoform X1 [Astyanax mexicanus]
MSTMNRDLDEDALQELYAWIDQINLSRPKRNIARDFSDGVMIAEVVKHFYPKLVDLHNYTPAHSTQQKLSNWNTLNRKVFSKLNFHIPEDTVKKITLSTAGTIEPVLCALRIRLEDKQTGKNLEGTQEPVEYYSTVNEKAQSGNRQVIVTTDISNKTTAPVKKTQKSSPLPVAGQDVDPAFRLLLEEKEQALLALQETVEILQIKVNRLEHLVHLKDLRIEDLTKHLERYKSRHNNIP